MNRANFNSFINKAKIHLFASPVLNVLLPVVLKTTENTDHINLC